METFSIVEANPYFLPHLGGIENRMHVTSKHLAKRGHDVTVLTAQLPGTPAEEETEYGYRIVRVPSKFYNIYRFTHSSLTDEWAHTWKTRENINEGADKLATFRVHMNNTDNTDYYHERSFRDK